jgi:DNA-binding XRE family transcriptional regulator
MEASTKTARVMKAGRRLLGLSQVEFAKTLNISQGTISKTEAGVLLPTLDIWFNLCLLLKVDSSYAYDFGVIETPVRKTHTFYNETYGFKCNKDYLKDFHIKSRDLLPLIEIVGFDQWETFCKKKIEPLVAIVLSAPISMDLALDFLIWIQEEHSSKLKDWSKLKTLSTSIHGNLFEQYSSKKTVKNLVIKFVKNLAHYETVFDYNIEEKKNGLEIHFTPNDRVQHIANERKSFEKYAEYKANSISSFPLSFLSEKYDSKISMDHDKNIYTVAFVV